MAGGQLVHKGKGRAVAYNPSRMQQIMARNMLRYAMRAWKRRKQISKGISLARSASKKARDAIVRRNRNNYRGRNRRFYRIQGMAQGTTHTTTRMMVRPTPRKQRFMRKLFKTNPVKNMYVNRFGFAWMGATAASKTIWYSVCNLKLNNLSKFMAGRVTSSSQNINQQTAQDGSTTAMANSPDSYIYLGKCTYTYEIYNPTNYIVTVYIYDLICKRDTPYNITYADIQEEKSCAPENMMRRSAQAQYSNTSSTNPLWVIQDPVHEGGSNNLHTYYNTVGMKPTDYHYFNTFWKVKGMKKIVLPPTSSHHHVVVFNPKVKITQASLYMPRQLLNGDNEKQGVAGITQATLFGFQGQIAVENDQSTDNTSTVGTLPGKLIISCVRKENVWSGIFASQNIIQDTNMKEAWTKPTIFTDLVEQDAGAT